MIHARPLSIAASTAVSSAENTGWHEKRSRKVRIAESALVGCIATNSLVLVIIAGLARDRLLETIPLQIKCDIVGVFLCTNEGPRTAYFVE
jgi:hypothetical protein